MAYDVKLIGTKLRRWENYLNSFRLPQWNELPDMDLYMDQVVILLQRYLNFLPEDEHGNAAITASIINNYVRLKIMPPPIKKKYTRVHMAYPRGGGAPHLRGVREDPSRHLPGLREAGPGRRG